MAATRTLTDMGEDVKGIEWFSVMAEEYCNSKYGNNVRFTNFASGISYHRIDMKQEKGKVLDLHQLKMTA